MKTLNKNIFKAYDVRGIYPADVNVESVEAITEALVKLWKPGSVVIAHDGRHGSELLAKTAEARIIGDQKQKVIFVGLSTTPMFYFLVNHLNASGGAMITASHNPKEYNGMKAVVEHALPVTGLELYDLIEKNHGL